MALGQKRAVNSGMVAAGFVTTAAAVAAAAAPVEKNGHDPYSGDAACWNCCSGGLTASYIIGHSMETSTELHRAP